MAAAVITLAAVSLLRPADDPREANWPVTSAALTAEQPPQDHYSSGLQVGFEAPAEAPTEVDAEAMAAAFARMSPAVAELARSGNDDRVRIIVETSDTELISKALAAGASVETLRSYEHLPFVAVALPANQLIALAGGQGVRFLSLDGTVEASAATPTLADVVNGNGKKNSRYKHHAKAHDIANALLPDEVQVNKGIGIAVIDSGVARNLDVDYLVTQHVDFVDSSRRCIRRGCDAFGHGTHVAGAIAGDGYHSPDFYFDGVAPYSRLISLRVLDKKGQGDVSALLAALDWVLANSKRHNIRVVNLSLGKAVETRAEDDPLVQAVETVWDAGIVVIASAGNYGRDGNFTITSPGNARKIITVGSLSFGNTVDTDDDYVSTFSSRGPTLYDHFVKPDLVAPGNRIVATAARNSKLAKNRAGKFKDAPPSAGNYRKALYMELSGTSMAAALVSGTATLMLSQDPTLSPSTIKARLMRSARKAPYGTLNAGAGVLDIRAALAEKGHVDGQALSPKMVRSDEGEVFLVEDTGCLWGDPTFGAAYLWSDGYLWSDSFLWSDGYLWSDAFLWSDKYVWSDASLWNDAFLWSDGFLWSDAYLWSDKADWSDNVDDEDPLLELNGNSVTVNAD